jgi:phenol 2-monooxygenase
MSGGGLPYEQWGHWRLLTFSGDIRRKERMQDLTFPNTLRAFISNNASSKLVTQGQLEILLIHSSPRTEVNLLDCLRHSIPLVKSSGGITGRLLAIQTLRTGGSAGPYKGYGVDEGEKCLVLCRPDQHVAWTGRFGQLDALNPFSVNFFTLLGTGM